jgi:hemolysin activation/secretion protein
MLGAARGHAELVHGRRPRRRAGGPGRLSAGLRNRRGVAHGAGTGLDARDGGPGLRSVGGKAGLCLLIACAWALARAQAPAIPSETRPGEKPLPLPEFRKPPPAELLDLPPLKPEAERLPFAVRVVVRKFQITGNTALSDAELAAIAAPYENREITSAELEDLRRRLTLAYVNRGYVNSGAVIPDQRISDGVVEIRIIEGRLARVEVEGTQHFRKEYFSERLARRGGPPLNVRELEQELQLRLRDPLVASINAQLAPGERPGEAVLHTRVTEAPRYELGATLDNKLSPSLGEAVVTLQAGMRNLLGTGDVLSAELGVAEGIDHDLRLRYRTPFTARDTFAGLYYDRARSEIVQSPFDVLDIRTEIETAGLLVGQPVYRTLDWDVILSAALERRTSDTFLLGEPFSFSPGVVDGRSVVSVARLIQELVQRTREHVLAVRSTFSIGLDAFGSTIHENAPDSRFFAWLGQLQWVRRFGARGHQVHFRLNGQAVDDSLLPLEQFSVGGLDSVRGFRTNQVVRDYGYTASLEYRLPVFANPGGWRNLQLAAFVDTGAAKNRAGPNPDPSRLTGIGLGVVWSPSARYFAEIYFADGRTDMPEQPGHSLQDDGVHFRFVAYPWRP